MKVQKFPECLGSEVAYFFAFESQHSSEPFAASAFCNGYGGEGKPQGFLDLAALLFILMTQSHFSFLSSKRMPVYAADGIS